MGKTSLEPQILEEAEKYIDHYIKPNLGKPFSLANSLHQATSNTISQMLFSRRFDYGDITQNSAIDAIEDMFKLGAQLALIENLPLGTLLSRNLRRREQSLNLDVLLPTLGEYIDETKRTIERQHPRNLIDRYIIHSETAKGERQNCFSGASILASCISQIVQFQTVKLFATFEQAYVRDC